ncbi:DMT family transporter [Vibrio diazotrophicus]|uniref:DMT family transporter n=1 Tax=Vibrio diazotrophicus TaxID=685 RepID=UPI000C9E6F8D|nr:DMT family transporter [Vibrio diazotrophicus]PNH77790.1 EamA family transporter [Vibrio diazotrophicus]
MSETRLNINISATFIMIIICFIWGTQQAAIKTIADQISPVLQIGLRSIFATLLVCLVIFIKNKELLQVKNYVFPGLIVGALFGSEFLFVAEGLKITSTSHMTVFIYSAPIFSAIGLQLFNKHESLTKVQWIGVIIASLGIVVAFITNDKDTNLDMNNSFLGDMMALTAGFLWGATTVVIRCSQLRFAPAEHTLFFQLGGAGVLLLTYAYLTDQFSFSLSYNITINLLAQVLFVSFASYLAWFSLIRKYKASQLGILSFLTPIIGVISGIILLEERVSSNFTMGSIMILIGVIIVSTWPWLSVKIKNKFRQ